MLPKEMHLYSTMLEKNIFITKIFGAGDLIRQKAIRGPTDLEIEAVSTTRGIRDIRNLEILVALGLPYSCAREA